MANNHRLDHAPFLVLPGTQIRLKDFDPAYTAGFRDKRAAEEALSEDISRLGTAQDVLWANKEYAVIIIFQALDAAGKDGTIEHVMSGVNAQGVIVHSFKAPSEEERMHHFLWRPMRALPACGAIAIFNRSYYEEVLVVRVHPEFLEKQWLPHELREMGLDAFWKRRYREITEFERALSGQNVIFLKFFLNVSRDEQKKRFLKRLDDPVKNWKFSANDVRERRFWNDYQLAYEEMLSATSTTEAPWYIIPADKKWFTRACVADIISNRIESLGLTYPKLDEKALAALAEVRQELESENR